MRDLRCLIHSFVFVPPLSPEEVTRFQNSDDPWESLAHLVHRASLGDFAVVAQVEQLLRGTRQTLFWSVATAFAGLAGSRETIERIAAAFRPAPPGCQSPLAFMLMYAFEPSFTDPLLELHEAAEDDETRQGISWNLSFLLEPRNGLVWIGPRESDKYGDDWRFEVREAAFHHEGGEAWVFEVAPVKALGFDRNAGGSQTRWRFADQPAA